MSSARLGGLFGRALLPASLVALVGGIALHLAGSPDAGVALWAAITALVALHLGSSIVSALRRGEVGVDLIAVVAMAGSLAFGEMLAGAVIALMITTGQALEAYADGRARRELAALLSRAPRVVHRYEDGRLTSPPIEEVAAGDRLMVKPGEVVPVDGVVFGEAAVLDESALTGESRLVTREAGSHVSSGTLNAGAPFDLVAIAAAEASTYAGIVRLVREASASKAPFVRLADRFALVFLPITFGTAGLAWLLSGDPVRALAVLVVATPCPLILAAPIAIVAGISRAAKRGIIVKGGGALETLARARVALFDKTGTLTAGSPQVADIEAFGTADTDELLRLAASVEQLSPHVLAGTIVRAAHDHRLRLSFPTDVEEIAGAGVRGIVDGRRVSVGTAEWTVGGGPLPQRARDLRRRAALEGSMNAFVALDGRLIGALVLKDPIRPETPRALRHLRRAGITRIAMVTGDHPTVAETVGAAIGVDVVFAERSPAEKLDVVATERADATGVVMMIGDGINDAPALAAADVGVAMGARGATASSEAADVVIVVDRLDRLAEAVRIATRSRRIAVESVVLGMGLSVLAMAAAALGALPPVAGAILQEAIDVVVILNALRALGGGPGERGPRIAGWAETGSRLRAEHRELAPQIARIRRIADRLDEIGPPEAAADLATLGRFLAGPLLEHELHEDGTIYPMLSRAMGDDATAALSRTHREIFHLIRLVERTVAELADDGPGDDDLRDLRRMLYGLHAILELHMSQEEELYLGLGDEVVASAPVRAAA